VRVLITGNKGFIGSYLEKAYVERKITVFGWDKCGVSCNGNVLQDADLMETSDVENVLEIISPDLIIHCAGSADVNKSTKDPLSDLKANYIPTENLLFALKKLGLLQCRFMLLSSAAVYGNPVTLPMDENQPINPLSPYALHKRAAEDVCIFMNKNYGLDIKIARLFSVYGPGLRKQIFWDMYQKIIATGELNLFGSGEESRDYIFIDDVVNALMLIAEDTSGKLVYNVANGEETTIKEAARCFSTFMNIPSTNIHFMGERREGDPINWRADIGRLKKLGYIRNVSFEDGLRSYVEWVNNI
jgi:nucleoside-diphosphate-sugar epimerase